MNFHLIEIKKFFKKKFLEIALGTFIVTLTFLFITHRTNDKAIQTDENITNKSESTENVVEASPSNFFFYVEYEDGQTYTNNFLIEQYFLTPEILNKANTFLNFDIVDFIDETDNLINVIYSESKEVEAVSVIRNEKTHLMEFKANVGKESTNLAIADFYYNMIIEKKIPILSDKNVFIFKEPAIKELTNSFDPLVDENAVKGSSGLIADIIIGVSLGLIISITLLFVIQLFSKKLVYSFSYFVNEKDNFILIDKKLSNHNILFNMLDNTKDVKKSIVSEQQLSYLSEIMNDSLNLKQINFTNNILNAVDEQRNKTIFLIVEEGITSRLWYETQIKLVHRTDIPVVVFQINE